MANDTKQRVTLKVDAGLFVLRYLGGPDARTAPRAFVQPSANCASDIDVINAPGAAAGEMPAPGSNLVLVARRSGSVDVTIEAVEGSSNLEARFSLDLLAAAQQLSRPFASTEAGVRSTPAVGAPRPATAKGSPRVELAAHVSRRGDVVADEAGWIGGPKAPTPVEGIEVRCSGAEVSVAGQFTNTLDPQRWSVWQTPGGLVGTYQKASPLTGLRLKLVGPDASRFELDGEALFLGSAVNAQRGTEVEFLSEAGVDPLVGIRLALVERVRVEADPPAKSSRVRVFR